MTNRTRWILAAAALAILAWGGGVIFDYFDQTSPGHLAIRDWLTWIGQGVYEYHAQTGNWPSSYDDLAKTSLPTRWPLWKSAAENMVLMWPKDLKDDPKENRSVMLGYYEKGLLSQLGRKWVLWGDLRTEYLPENQIPGGRK
jgi:hypothetical protein